MKINSCLAALLALLASPAFAAETEWLTDLHIALEKARDEHKVVLLDFTVSDWEPSCIKLKNEVFDTPEFAAFARKNLVLMEVDFPHHKSLTPEQEEVNQALARHYDIKDYPTVILVNGLSQKVGEAGYMPGGPKNFIAVLEKVPGIRHADGAAAIAAAAADSRPEPHRPAPDPRPIPPSAPNVYDQIALNGISIGRERMATINSTTVAVGETTKIKVKNGSVEIVCNEIRDDSAVITVNGVRLELKLGKK